MKQPTPRTKREHYPNIPTIKDELRVRAGLGGVRSSKYDRPPGRYLATPREESNPVPVYFTRDMDRPPTLQRVFSQDVDRQRAQVHPLHRKRDIMRRVVVGQRWMVENMGEGWAAYCALRLLGQPPTERYNIPTLSED